MKISRRTTLAATAALLATNTARAEKPVTIVAAENMYGDIARQIGGNLVTVTSILNNPNQDPHLFTTSPSVAIELAGADIVIVNGADYDPWMAGLLAAQPAPDRIIITIADLLGRKPGDNPHLWYDPAAIPHLATQLVKTLQQRDPGHAAIYAQNAQTLLASLAPIVARIAAMRAKFAGTPVTATEPVFGLMAAALGLVMRNMAFQIAVMNDTEPAPSDVAAFENDLRGRHVKILFYNSQVTDDLTANLRAIAGQSGIPVVGVTETEPAGKNYQAWMTYGLDAVEKALTPE
jgi:zinc/manganese transport system substrate-binding protein